MRLQEPTTSQPPAPAPASGLVVEHQAWREARDQVFAAIRAGQGLVLLSGPPGTGKTLLLQELTRMLRAAGFDALLQPRGDIPVEPGHSGEGERIRPRVVLVDEADRMDEAVLERLGRLRARSLVLAGLTKARRWPAGPSVTTVSLTPLEASEAGRFLAARLSQAGQPADRFAPDVVARLAEQAGGVPRVLDMLAGAVLFLAGSGPVRVAHVDEAALRSGGVGTSPPAAPTPRDVPVAPLAADPAFRSGIAAGGGAPARYRAAALSAAAGVAALCGWLTLQARGPARPEAPAMIEWSPTTEIPAAPPAEPAPLAERAASAIAGPEPQDTVSVVAAPESQTAVPAAPLESLPSSAPARVLLQYSRGEAGAAFRAAAVALALREMGLTVDEPVAAAARSRPGVRYFFPEDGDTAAGVLRSAKLPGQSVLASAKGRSAPPPPGTIEVTVSNE